MNIMKINSLEIKNLDINGLSIIKTSKLKDSRGSFGRLFCLRELDQIWNNCYINQINRTFTKKKGQLEEYIFNILHLKKKNYFMPKR